jgi:hypothetical protein
MRNLVLISLLAMLSCTSETHLSYTVDYRYLQAIPDYSDGQVYFNSENDTVILKLTTTDSRFISSNIMAPNGSNYSYEELNYTYNSISSTPMNMVFSVSSFPTNDFKRPALTTIEFYSIQNFGLTLHCSETDTVVPYPNLVYYKTWQHQGKTYNEVYADTSLFYYSMDGEIIRFKSLGKWFDQP